MKAIEIISVYYHNRTKHKNAICSRIQSFFLVRSQSDYQHRHVRPSFYPHASTLLPSGGFSLNLTFENFSKICLENSTLIYEHSNGYFT
jgi:hypothetical protein